MTRLLIRGDAIEPRAVSPMTRFRAARSLRLAATVAFVALLVNPGIADACSCATQTLADYADQVAVAFAGRQILRIEHPSTLATGWSSADPVTLVFEVNRVYKGTVGPIVKVHTVRESPSCGIDFSGKRNVGVAAFSRSPHSQGGLQNDLHVSWCGSQVTIAELEHVFGAGYPPNPHLIASPEPVSTSPEPAEGSALPTALVSGGGALILTTIGLFVWRRKRQPPRP